MHCTGLSFRVESWDPKDYYVAFANKVRHAEMYCLLVAATATRQKSTSSHTHTGVGEYLVNPNQGSSSGIPRDFQGSPRDSLQCYMGGSPGAH